MEKSKVYAILSQYQNIIPQDKKNVLKEALEKADDSAYDNLVLAKTYNPSAVFVCSLFFGGLGVDRFMIGDAGLGVCKLFFGWLTFGLWPFIDMFCSFGAAKKRNLKNLLDILKNSENS